MKTKTSAGLGVLVLVVLAGLAWWLARDDIAAPTAAPPPSEAAAAASPVPAAKPGRARPPIAAGAADSDVIDGRVLDGVTHEGVGNAELTFVGETGVSTFRTSSDGTFVLTPPATGTLALATITAPGFVPYAPELEPSGVRLTLARGPAVHGVTLLLHPAIDYDGVVVDARGEPVAGARVRLLVTATSDPVRDSLAAEWSAGPDGHFTFQAADDAVLEARRGHLRGSAAVDRSVRIQKKLRIQLGHVPPLDATITGHVRDRDGAPIADALVRAVPSSFADVPSVFTTTGPDGAFTIENVDRASYDVSADAEDHVRAVRGNVLGGSRSVVLTLDAGLLLAGQVVDHKGAPVPTFTLIVRRLVGVARLVVETRSLVDPQGRFAVRVPRGDYDLLASVRGCACGTPTRASAGAIDVRLVLGTGATLRGKVIASDDHTPIGNASIACETIGDRLRRTPLGQVDSAPPGDAGTVTSPDGTFELTGIPAGPLAVRVRAEGFHTWIEGTIIATEGATLGPIKIELTRVEPDERSSVELVGIGVSLNPDGDALRVGSVVPFSGAFDAGIGYGDRVIAIDGMPVSSLGLDGALARIRGAAGTTVALTLRVDGRDLRFVVERRKLRGSRA